MKFVLALIASATAINLTKNTPDSGDDTTHGYSVHANDGHNAVLTRAANLETARVAAVAGTEASNAWRKGNTYYTWA